MKSIAQLSGLSLAFLATTGAAQIEVGGPSDNELSATIVVFGRPRTVVQPLHPPTTGAIDESVRTGTRGSVGAAAFRKTATEMFLHVSTAAGSGQARAHVRFSFRNVGSAPVRFSVVGYLATSPLHRNGQIEYQGSAPRSFQVPGSIRFEDTIAAGGSGTFRVATSAFASPAGAVAQAVLSVAIRDATCARESIANETRGMVPGEFGVPPILALRGCASSGPTAVELQVARGNASTMLFVGVPSAGLPLLGGVLHPALGALAVPVVTGPPAASGFGGWRLPVAVPRSLVGTYSLQALVLDGAAGQGVAFSNALTLTLR